MEAIELFFATYENTAWAFFSFSGFCFVCYRVYKGHREGIKEQARHEQRNEFQAEFFDRNHGEFKELQAKYEDVLVELTEIKFILKS